MALWRCSYESRPAGEKFLHHGLLEGAGLSPPLLQHRQLPVHLRQHRRDGGLFGEGWKLNLVFLSDNAGMSLALVVETLSAVQELKLGSEESVIYPRSIDPHESADVCD